MALSRRNFLVGLASGSVGLRIGSLASDALRAQANSALAAARQRAAHRSRRVVFNNDGDDIWAAGANTEERFLATRHTPLLGTHVDSIHYCTTQSFNYFTHHTKVAEVFTSQGGQFADNNLAQFLEQDTDGLRMSILLYDGPPRPSISAQT